jgi:hypothetical protein
VRVAVTGTSGGLGQAEGECNEADLGDAGQVYAALAGADVVMHPAAIPDPVGTGQPAVSGRLSSPHALQREG